MYIKICGLSREEDIQICNDYKPDFIGFVFAKSKRQVTIDKAKHLKSLVDPSIKVVGVFVDEEIEIIRDIVKQDIIDIIQLHGHEDQEYINNLKDLNVPIIKALKYPRDNDIRLEADYYLLDGITPGSGETFDWSLIETLDKPYFLAGGLNESNIKEALKTTAIGLDMSSGVEVDGFKDREKIKNVIRSVRDE